MGYGIFGIHCSPIIASNRIDVKNHHIEYESKFTHSVVDSILQGKPKTVLLDVRYSTYVGSNSAKTVPGFCILAITPITPAKATKLINEW